MVAAATGATGDFSILANIQAKMNYGQLNKTPSADLKASIAAAPTSKPEVKCTAASPTAPKVGAGFGLKSPAETGGTGGVSILAKIQAQMNNGKMDRTPSTPSDAPAKRLLHELCKTPSSGLKASIAPAVQAANAVANHPIMPPSSPIPRGAATSHMTPMIPSPITTPNTPRRDSYQILNRVQPRPCNTTEVFNNLTQGMPFLGHFSLLMIE
jgi:hypothetical protein